MDTATAKKPSALATLLTSDSFLPGVQALCYSLAKYPLPSSIDKVVLVTKAVSKATLYQLKKIPHLKVKKVDDIPNPHADSCTVPGWVNSGYSKLRIWEMDDEYDCVVYIDSDCVVVGDGIARLFELQADDSWNGFSASPDVFPPDKFNAGVLVICPSSTTFADMLSKVDSLPSHDKGDTGFLNSYYEGWYSDMKKSRCGAKR